MLPEIIVCVVWNIKVEGVCSENGLPKYVTESDYTNNSTIVICGSISPPYEHFYAHTRTTL